MPIAHFIPSEEGFTNHLNFSLQLQTAFTIYWQLTAGNTVTVVLFKYRMTGEHVQLFTFSK